MSVNILKAERDAIAFLGLMSNMYTKFDTQVNGPDGQPTHTNGLNIHALIIDNATGKVLGLQHNSIHHSNNPLLHAEQLTLKEAVEKKNQLSPRDPATTSVEEYYRNLLFNDAQSYDALNAGATIYTTLEPCPFCTSALLVSRMKRIVFITPDSTYGNSFYSLWTTYYKKYDCHYEQFALEKTNSPLIAKVQGFLSGITAKIKLMGSIPGTLYFDTLSDDLKAISEYFQATTEADLITTGQDLSKNSILLNELKAVVYP